MTRREAPPKRNNDEREPAPSTPSTSRSGVSRLAGCLLAPFLAPFRLIFKQFRFMLVVMAISFGVIGGCALFAPAAFQGAINAVRSAGYKVYTLILSVTGSAALKITTFEGTVTASVTVERDLGALSVIYGEGAKIEGQVRVALGADLLAAEKGKYGILTCEVLTDSLRISVGRAPLANSAFNKDQILQDALNAFRQEAARVTIEKYWADARRRLKDNFVSWGLGAEIPDTPTLTTCPN